MTNLVISQKVETFVKKYIEDNIPEEYKFHSLNHTQQVVENSIEMAEVINLDQNDLEILLISAWFHDTGYAVDYNNHEEESKKLAEKFLQEEKISKEIIEKVISAIDATKMPQSPKNVIEEILCDADLLNLSKKTFFKQNDYLLSEKVNICKCNVSKEDWLKHTVEFMESHKYHTAYAQKVYEKKKQKNLLELKNIMDGKEKPEKKEKKKDKKKEKNLPVNETENKINKKIEEMKMLPPARGIETMFRNNLRGHLELSALADNKANIMLSVNAVIISIVLPSLFPKFYDEPWLIVPTTILLLTCLLTITAATISTRPKITSGTFKKDDIRTKKANLLFFGNFHKMKLNDFEWGMQEMMNDRDFLYGSMIRDFYYLGKVLHVKYKYLNICYNIFMYGFIIALITFFIAFSINEHHQNINP